MTTKRALIALLLLLLTVVPSIAQDVDSPLILVKNGDLWEWTGGPALRQKTQWGYNYGLSKSLYTQEVAYGSVATVVVDYITANGGLGGGPLPNNIWVIASAVSDEAYRVADQPADASFMVPGVPENTLIRSGAMWSPDGTQIAWAETGYAQDGSYRLMIYDKASQTTRIVTTGLPQQYGMGAGLNGVWLFEGIVLYSYEPNPTDPSGAAWHIIIIDPGSGTIRATVALPTITTSDDSLMPWLKLPVLYKEHRAIGVLYIGQKATSQWYAVNIESGTLEAVSAAPIGRPALEGADSTISVVPRVMSNNAVGYDFFQADGTPITLTHNARQYAYNFAFSPDGHTIAYQLATEGSYEYDHTVYILRDGHHGSVPQTDYASQVNEFVWGETWWQFPE